MALRPYQDKLIIAVRSLLSVHRCVMMQLATGGGKTRIFCEMVALAIAKSNPVWIVVPRNELLGQASKQLTALKQVHGKISAKHKESVAYKVHVVSKDTLLRRIKAGKVKKWPKVIIFDEAHLAIDQQLFIRDHAPEETRFIGVTATPERLDGRGLDEMYGDITYGPSIKDLVEMGYLCDVKYFGIPGLSANDFKAKDFSGTEIKQEILDEILTKRNVYGNMISHYRELAHNKACIVFCRSVKSAEETAQRFRDAGYRFESIDGKMTDKQREALIDGLKSGRLHGLTSVDLICYGLDVPKVECIIKLRFTISKALDSQMNGRGLRPYEGKDYCIILDPVGCMAEHGHPLDDYEWQFHGKEKRGKKKGVDPAALQCCAECFMHYVGTTCPHCGTERGTKPQKKYEEIEGRLVEIKGPIKLQERPIEEQREVQDKIGNLVDQLSGGEIDPGAIGELLALAKDLGHNAMWVYWLLSKDRLTVNVPLLHELKRQLNYTSGWIWMQQEKVIKPKLGRG